jgi:hypothetical protein
MVLNQIGNVVITTARLIAFDRYSENRGTKLHPRRRGHAFHLRRRHDHRPGARGDRVSAGRATERRRAPAHLGRRAASDEEAAGATQGAEDMLAQLRTEGDSLPDVVRLRSS